MPRGVYERKPYHKTHARPELYPKIVEARDKGMTHGQIAIYLGVSKSMISAVLKNPLSPEWNPYRNKINA